MTARQVKDELFEIDSDAHYALANFVCDGDCEMLAFRLEALARKAMDLRLKAQALAAAGAEKEGMDGR